MLPSSLLFHYFPKHTDTNRYLSCTYFVAHDFVQHVLRVQSCGAVALSSCIERVFFGSTPWNHQAGMESQAPG